MKIRPRTALPLTEITESEPAELQRTKNRRKRTLIHDNYIDRANKKAGIIIPFSKVKESESRTFTCRKMINKASNRKNRKNKQNIVNGMDGNMEPVDVANQIGKNGYNEYEAIE